MHIAIATHFLCQTRGGAERVAVELAGQMLRRGHAVTLHSWEDPHGNAATPAYPLPPGAVHKAWNWGNGATEERARLRRFLMDDGTDVFLSLQSDKAGLFCASACLGTGIPFVHSERDIPVLVETAIWNRPGRLAAMSGADAIHLLLPSYVESVPAPLRARIRVIPNAAPENALPAHIEEAGQKTLLYLGRLTDFKRPALLVRAFALLCGRHPDWRLDIWGVGPEAPRVRRLLSELGLKERVRLRGLCLDPPAAYAKAQCYCLPSRLEGLPNTVLEAMSAGLPVVGVADCTAMRSIVTPGGDGLLADEAIPECLAATLDKLMADAAMRRRLGEKARQTAQRYAPERIFDQWETLLAEMAGRKGHTAMDGFADEPFATRAELSRLARQEWLFRQNGEPLPCSSSWLWQRGKLAWRTLMHKARPAQQRQPCKQRREE